MEGMRVKPGFLLVYSGLVWSGLVYVDQEGIKEGKREPSQPRWVSNKLFYCFSLHPVADSLGIPSVWLVG